MGYRWEECGAAVSALERARKTADLRTVESQAAKCVFEISVWAHDDEDDDREQMLQNRAVVIIIRKRFFQYLEGPGLHKRKRTFCSFLVSILMKAQQEYLRAHQ